MAAFDANELEWDAPEDAQEEYLNYCKDPKRANFTINLQDKRLSSFPPLVHCPEETETIRIPRNPKVTRIPDDITRLTGLRLLHMSKTSVTNFDPLVDLPNLCTIFASGCNISSLPETISRMTALTNLHMDGNNLAYLPINFSCLTNLRTLYLGGMTGPNLPMTTLPSGLTALTRLEYFNFRLDNMTNPPPGIARGDALRAFLATADSWDPDEHEMAFGMHGVAAYFALMWLLANGSD